MQRKNYFFLVLVLSVSFQIALSERSFGNDLEGMTPEKLIAAHVKSIGSPALLAKIQSREFLGTSNVEFISGMNGIMKGTSMFISEGPKLGIVMKYSDNKYPGEYFAYDGKDVTVGNMSPGQRSPIGDFLFRFNKIIKGGFISGTMTSAWPLLDMKDKKVDVKYRRTKVEGRELHELEYHPKTGFGDMRIRMYFDLTTFRHVRTEYKVRASNDAAVLGDQLATAGASSSSSSDPTSNAIVVYNSQMRGGPTDTTEYDATSAINNASANNGRSASTQMGGIGRDNDVSYYTLVEKFEDYKRVGGVMLPHRYMLDYSLEGNGQPFIGHWTVVVDQWKFNAANVDQKLFRALK
jgi:hypothetical protein